MEMVPAIRYTLRRNTASIMKILLSIFFAANVPDVLIPQAGYSELTAVQIINRVSCVILPLSFSYSL